MRHPDGNADADAVGLVVELLAAGPDGELLPSS